MVIDVKEEDKPKKFKLLDLLEFSSKRKRMSVIVQDEEGKYFLYCKGADNIIINRCSNQPNGVKTQKLLDDYSRIGLRTLALAKKSIEKDVYKDWKIQYKEACTDMSKARKEKMENL